MNQNLNLARIPIPQYTQNGGSGGIRTHEPFYWLPVFETGAINRALPRFHVWVNLERIARLELACSAWKAGAQPMGQIRALYRIKMVGDPRFELGMPEASDLQSDGLTSSPNLPRCARYSA
jgi:hypothetical protein